MAAIQWVANRFLGVSDWPPPQIRQRWADAEAYAALRANDEPIIRAYASQLGQGGHIGTPYVIVPLPRLLSKASANLLFGEDPDIDAADSADSDAMSDLIRENKLPSEAKRAALLSSSEGEVWAKISVAPALLDWPIIDFVSTRRVIPEWRGRFLVAATFVTEWRISDVTILRMLERHEAGRVTIEAWEGTQTSKGHKVSLDAHEETQGWPEEALTGFDHPLVAYIPNIVEDSPVVGVSDYDAVWSYFFALNETATVGQSNVRSVGKKRLAVNRAVLNDQGSLSNDELIVVEGDPGVEPALIKEIQYAFEAGELVSWVDSLIDQALMMAGVAPSTVGRSVDGGAVSGTALRLKMAHSLMEAGTKARHYIDALAPLIRDAAIIDSKPGSFGGFNRGWTDPESLPSITLGDGLPLDSVEEANEVATLVGAKTMSIETAVRRLHPDWDDDEVEAEVARIEEDDGLGQPEPPPNVPGLPEGTPPPAGPASEAAAGSLLTTLAGGTENAAT